MKRYQVYCLSGGLGKILLVLISSSRKKTEHFLLCFTEMVRYTRRYTYTILLSGNAYERFGMSHRRRAFVFEPTLRQDAAQQVPSVM